MEDLGNGDLATVLIDFFTGKLTRKPQMMKKIVKLKAKKILRRTEVIKQQHYM